MLLDRKVAVVYGGAGALGSEVARRFAAEGAVVFLAGRTPETVRAVADEIRWSGGQAFADSVDAMDAGAVDDHMASIIERAGRIDVSLNAVGVPHIQGTALADLSYEEYALPLHAYARTNFLTCRAAGLQMVKQGAGVILTISTPGSQMAAGGFMGYGAACAAIEAMTRHLAGELGPSGVRAVCLRSEAIPEALDRGSHAWEAFRKMAVTAGLNVPQMLDERAQRATVLKRFPRLGEFADAAVLAASDRASVLTAAILNLTAGTLVD